MIEHTLAKVRNTYVSRTDHSLKMPLRGKAERAVANEVALLRPVEKGVCIRLGGREAEEKGRQNTSSRVTETARLGEVQGGSRARR